MFVLCQSNTIFPHKTSLRTFAVSVSIFFSISLSLSVLDTIAEPFPLSQRRLQHHDTASATQLFAPFTWTLMNRDKRHRTGYQRSPELPVSSPRSATLSTLTVFAQGEQNLAAQRGLKGHINTSTIKLLRKILVSPKVLPMMHNFVIASSECCNWPFIGCKQKTFCQD